MIVVGLAIFILGALIVESTTSVCIVGMLITLGGLINAYIHERRNRAERRARARRMSRNWNFVISKTE